MKRYNPPSDPCRVHPKPIPVNPHTHCSYCCLYPLQLLLSAYEALSSSQPMVPQVISCTV